MQWSCIISHFKVYDLFNHNCRFECDSIQPVYSVSTLKPTLHTHPQPSSQWSWYRVLRNVVAGWKEDWMHCIVCICDWNKVLQNSILLRTQSKLLHIWHHSSFMGVWTKMLIENCNAISNIWFEYNFINNSYVFVEMENCISCAYVVSMHIVVVNLKALKGVCICILLYCWLLNLNNNIPFIYIIYTCMHSISGYWIDSYVLNWSILCQIEWDNERFTEF